MTEQPRINGRSLRYVILDEAQSFSEARVDRLLNGDRSFGHAGEHNGKGTAECPREAHHHCDEFCEPPTQNELVQAGIDPKSFRPKSRK